MKACPLCRITCTPSGRPPWSLRDRKRTFDAMAPAGEFITQLVNFAARPTSANRAPLDNTVGSGRFLCCRRWLALRHEDAAEDQENADPGQERVVAHFALAGRRGHQLRTGVVGVEEAHQRARNLLGRQIEVEPPAHRQQNAYRAAQGEPERVVRLDEAPRWRCDLIKPSLLCLRTELGDRCGG